MGGTISVRHYTTNQTTLENHMDHSIMWKAVFPGSYTNISCNGELKPAIKETDILGNVYSYVELEIKPQKSITAICE